MEAEDVLKQQPTNDEGGSIVAAEQHKGRATSKAALRQHKHQELSAAGQWPCRLKANICMDK